MLFKDILILSSGDHHVQGRRKIAYFDRVHYEEHSVKVIGWDKCFRRRCLSSGHLVWPLKEYIIQRLFFKSDDHLVQWSEDINVQLFVAESIMGSISVDWAVTCDFKQCSILTSLDSDEHVQPPFRLRNLKWCSVSSLTLIGYSSDKQRLWSDCAFAAL